MAKQLVEFELAEGPLLVALGGPEAVAEQALMIVEVGEWFP